jgi:hypothetical protein
MKLASRYDLAAAVLEYGRHQHTCREVRLGQSCDCGFHVAATDAQAVLDAYDKQTPQEARSELEAAGVDVEGFLERLEDATQARCICVHTKHDTLFEDWCPSHGRRGQDRT